MPPIEDEIVIKSFHERMEKVEETLEKLLSKIDDLHTKLNGEIDKPGIITVIDRRLSALEGWRSSMSTRVKSRSSWVWGTVGAIIATALGNLIALIHTK
jgi:hypothetical protein